MRSASWIKQTADKLQLGTCRGCVVNASPLSPVILIIKIIQADSVNLQFGVGNEDWCLFQVAEENWFSSTECTWKYITMYAGRLLILLNSLRAQRGDCSWVQVIWNSLALVWWDEKLLWHISKGGIIMPTGIRCNKIDNLQVTICIVYVYSIKGSGSNYPLSRNNWKIRSFLWGVSLALFLWLRGRAGITFLWN